MAGAAAVYVDLHGTLGAVHGEVQGDFLEFELYPFATEAVRLLNQANFLVIATTNQNRIAAGRFTLEEFFERIRVLEEELELSGAHIDAVCCCPHQSEDKCDCSKPLAAHLELATHHFDVDLQASYTVGDTGSADILLAKAIGARGVLVRTGWGEASLGEFRHTWAGCEADYVALDLLDAARWIVGQPREE